MKMRFLKTVMQTANIPSNYALAKLLHTSTQLVDTWTGKAKGRDPEGMKLKFLCQLRKISGLSWNQFGKLIDEEFLSDRR